MCLTHRRGARLANENTLQNGIGTRMSEEDRIEAARQRYRLEREKRLRSDGLAQYSGLDHDYEETAARRAAGYAAYEAGNR